MATFTTIEQAEASRQENSTYMTYSGSTGLAKARLFIEACTFLIDNKPNEASQGSVRDRFESIEAARREAVSWAQVQSSDDNTDNATTVVDTSGGW